jgi:hypothetical protein
LRRGISARDNPHHLEAYHHLTAQFFNEGGTMSRQRTRDVALLAFLAMSLAVAVYSSAAWQPGKTGSPTLGHPQGHLLTDTDRATIKKAALAHLTTSAKGQTVRFMGVSTHAIREGPDTPENPQKHEVQALVFNYTTGKATRLRFDPNNGKMVGQEDVAGTISSSEEERKEGEKIIEADAKIFKKGDMIVGGFVINPPKGAPATKVPHRYLEFHVTGPNHTHQSLVVVDLTAKKIISSHSL